jgi:hypothetical protein
MSMFHDVQRGLERENGGNMYLGLDLVDDTLIAWVGVSILCACLSIAGSSFIIQLG